MSNLTTISVTKDSSDELISRVESVLSAAFASLIGMEYFVRMEAKTPFTEPIDHNKLSQGFTNKLKKTMERGHVIDAIFSNDGSGNIAAVASWAPPGIDNNIFDTEHGRLSRPLKNKYLAGRDYWYLSLLGRNPSDETKGAISQLIEPYLIRAKKEGLPVVLEASSPYSKSVYEHYGFKFYEEFYIGKGKVRVDDDSKLVEDANGSGIPQYFMIYNY